MVRHLALRRSLVTLIFVAVLLGSSGIAVATPASAQSALAGADGGQLQLPANDGPDLAQQADTRAQLEEEEEEAEEDEEEGGGALIGDWWGLGEEAQEAPYMGLVELGVVLLAVGLAGYSIGKRTGLLPPQYRRYLLPAHEWTMLVGTALTVPHFLFVEEWEGLGLAVGILLAIEVLSGVYGRHLHRHVIRLGRGEEPAPLVAYLIALPKRTVFSRWRRIHVMLTILTALVLVAHIVTAVGE